MKKKKLIFALLIVVLMQLVLFPTILAEETNYYRTLNDTAYIMKNSYSIKNTGTGDAFNVKTTVLIGAVSNSAYQQNIRYKVTPWPKYSYVDSDGNIFAEILLDKVKASETKIITVEKQLVNGGVSYSKDIYQFNADYTEFKKKLGSSKYFQPGEKVESTASEIIKKAESFDTSKTKVELAKDIYDFVNLYIAYDINSAYANKGALSALRTAKGVCEEYASLFVALCRALDIPARIVTGYWIDSDDSLEMGIWNDVSGKAHAWPEFYLPDVGWIPAEPTFIYTYNGKRTPHKDYFANILPKEIHLMTGYQQNKIQKDINVSYSSYGKAAMKISFLEQKVMPVASLTASDAFSDISSSWAKDYINKLHSKGILFAKQENLYKPTDNVTRAEFAAYLVNALKLAPKTDAVIFKDVKDSDAYASFIKTASAYGLIQGSQGYFKPNDTITRQDAAVIMSRAIALLGTNSAAAMEPEFVDNSQVSPYAKAAVKVIYSMKIMSGKPGNIFDPKNFTTRAEVSKILDNFIIATE